MSWLTNKLHESETLADAVVILAAIVFAIIAFVL